MFLRGSLYVPLSLTLSMYYIGGIRSMYYYDLNTSIDLRVSVIEEKRVLRVILDLPLTLRLSPHVVVIAGLEIVVILFQIVRDVASDRCLQESWLQGCLKQRSPLNNSACQHL